MNISTIKLSDELDAICTMQRLTMRTIILIIVYGLLLTVSTNTVAKKQKARFPAPQSDFQAHIQEVRQYLLENQMKNRTSSDVEYNLPFERKANSAVAYRGKFLLIHGLNDSPYVFSDVAIELANRGFDVRAILLPGHGSTPRAQLRMSANRWLNSARQQLKFWNTDDSVPIYLGGFSMGTVIATTLALENNNIAGLFLFSPAYKSLIHRLLRWASLYSRFKPWVFGGMIIEDNPTKYNSIPINGGAQYFKLTKILRHKWGRKKLNMPVLAVASVDDSVVDVKYFTKQFDRKFTSNRKQLILYSNAPQSAQSENVEYRSSSFPNLRILNQSHQGVLIAPTNPLFGEGGSILVCNGNDWATFSGCLYSKENHWYGAQHTPSPDTVPVARTTYNPDFEGVFEAFDRVFEIQ